MTDFDFVNPYEQIWKTRDLRALDAPIELDNKLSSFERGLGRFGKQMTATGYGLTALGAQGLENVIGENDVTKDIINWGLKGYDDTTRESQTGLYAPKVPDIEHIKTASDAMDWATGVLGEQLPMVASLFATGGLGGAIARIGANAGIKKLAKATVNNLVEEGVKKGSLKAVEGQVITQAMKDAAAKELLNTTIKGATTGAFAGTFGLEGGQAFGEQVHQGVNPADAVKTAIAVGGINGALELVTPYVVAKKIGLGAYAKKSIREIIEGSPDLSKKAIGLAKELGARVAAGATEGMITEGLTEGLQELTSIAGERWAKGDPLFSNLTDADWSRIKNSAAAGALVGGGMSGVGAVFGGPKKETVPKTKPESSVISSREQALESIRDRLIANIDLAEAAGDTKKVEELQKIREAYDRVLETISPRQPAELKETTKAPIEVSSTEASPIIENLTDSNSVIDNKLTEQETSDFTEPQEVDELLITADKLISDVLGRTDTKQTPEINPFADESAKLAVDITSSDQELDTQINQTIKTEEELLAQKMRETVPEQSLVLSEPITPITDSSIKRESDNSISPITSSQNSIKASNEVAMELSAKTGTPPKKLVNFAEVFDLNKDNPDWVIENDSGGNFRIRSVNKPSDKPQWNFVWDRDHEMANLRQVINGKVIDEAVIPTAHSDVSATTPWSDTDPWLFAELDADIKLKKSYDELKNKWGEDIANTITSDAEPQDITKAIYSLVGSDPMQVFGELESQAKLGVFPEDLGGEVAKRLIQEKGFSPNTVEEMVKLAPSGMKLHNISSNDTGLVIEYIDDTDFVGMYSYAELVSPKNSALTNLADSLLASLNVSRKELPKDFKVPAPPNWEYVQDTGSNYHTYSFDNGKELLFIQKNTGKTSFVKPPADVKQFDSYEKFIEALSTKKIDSASVANTPSMPVAPVAPSITSNTPQAISPSVADGKWAPDTIPNGYKITASHIISLEGAKIQIHNSMSKEEIIEVAHIHNYLKNAQLPIEERIKLFKELPKNSNQLTAFKVNHPYLIRKVSIDEASSIDHARELLSDILTRQDKYTFEDILEQSIKFDNKYGTEEFVAALATAPKNIIQLPDLTGWLENARSEEELLAENPFEGIWADYEINNGPGVTAARYGVIIVNPKTGKVLLRKVANQFEGITWDFARGGADRFSTPNAKPNLIDTNDLGNHNAPPDKRYMEHPLIAAKREALEEFGYDVKIIGQLAKGFYAKLDTYEGNMASLYYVGVPIGEQNNTHLTPIHGIVETDETRWVSLNEARQLITTQPTLGLSLNMLRDGQHKPRIARIARVLESVFNPAMQKSDLDYRSSSKAMEIYFTKTNGFFSEFPGVLPPSNMNKTFDNLTELQKMQVATALYVSKRFPNADQKTKESLQKEIYKKREAALRTWLNTRIDNNSVLNIVRGNAPLSIIENKLKDTGGKIVLSLWHGSSTSKEAMLGDIIDPTYFGLGYGGTDTKEGLYLTSSKEGATRWGKKTQVNILVAFNNLKIITQDISYSDTAFTNIIATAKAEGYDGVLFNHVIDSVDGRQVVAWKAENMVAGGGVGVGFTGKTLYQSKGELKERLDIDTAKTILSDIFGPIAQKMLDSKLLEFVESGGPDGVAGQWLGEEQKIKIYLDYISSPRELIGAVLHEGSHSGMREILGQSAEIYHKELLSSNTPATSSAIYKTAWEGAQRYGIENSLTPDNVAEITRVRAELSKFDTDFLIEEDLANFVQQANTSLPLWQKIFNAIKAWWAQSLVGKTLKKHGLGFELTPEMAAGLVTSILQTQSLRRGADYATYVAHVSGTNWASEKKYPHGRPLLKFILHSGKKGLISYGWGFYALESASSLETYKKYVGNKTYGLHLPDDISTRIIEWDRPLQQQSFIVKKAITSSRDNYLLLRMAVRSKDKQSAYSSSNLQPQEIGTGGAFYDELRDYFINIKYEGKNDEQFDPETNKQQYHKNLARRDASRKLAEYGVAGIRVLEPNSRTITITRLTDGKYKFSSGINNSKAQILSEEELIKQVGIELATKAKEYPINESKTSAGFGLYNWVLWRQSDLDRLTLVYKNGNQIAEKPKVNIQYDPNGVGIPYPENPGFADYIINPYTGDNQFLSKTGQTIEVSLEDLRNNIDSVMGNNWLEQAEQLGLIKVVNEVGPNGESGAWVGDKIILYAGSMPAGGSPIGVLLHEGKHATFKTVLGDSLNDYVKDLRILANNGNQTARDAIVHATVAAADILGIDHGFYRGNAKADLDSVRAAIEERKPGLLAEEELAYFIQYGVENQSGVGFLRRLMNQIKAWFAQTKLGQRLKEMDIGFELTEGMAVEWAKMGLHRSLAKLRKAEQMRAQVLYQAAYMAPSARLGKALDTLYSFAGQQAITANLSALQEAKSRIENGQDKEVVRQETGWFKGKDNKWRFEIDDSKLSFNKEWIQQQREEKRQKTKEMATELPDNLDGFFEPDVQWSISKDDKNLDDGDFIDNFDTQVGQLIYHPDLFKAYPQLKDININLIVNTRGTFDPRGSYDPIDNSIDIKAYSYSGAKKSLIHELQHAIQTIEGYSSGTNPNAFGEDGVNKYLRSFGEIEARATENRLNLTTAQRQDTPPYDRTMFMDGIADADVIINSPNVRDDIYYSMGIEEIKQQLWTDPTDIRQELVNKPGLLQRLRADFVDFFAEMEKKSKTIYDTYILQRAKKGARIEKDRQTYLLPLRELIVNSPWTTKEVGDMLAARHIKLDNVNIELAQRASYDYTKELLKALPKVMQKELIKARVNIKAGRMPDGSVYKDTSGNVVSMAASTKRKLMFDLMNKYVVSETPAPNGKQELREEWEKFKDAAGGFSNGGVAKGIVRTADEVLALASKDQVRFDKITNLFDAMNRHTLDILEEGGLITEKEHARLLSSKSAYAPLRRESYNVDRNIELLFARTGQGGSKQIATRAGTTNLSEPTLVLQNALAKVEAAAAASERNLANKELYKVVMLNREEWKPWFTIIEKDKYVTHDEDGFLSEKHATASNQADIVLINDGKKLVIRPNMHNERAMGFVRAVNNLDVQTLSGPIKIFGWVNSLVRWVNVNASPVFLMMNAIRDPFTAAYNLQATEAAPYTKEIYQNYSRAFKALKKVFIDGNRDLTNADVRMLERWEKAGGRTSFTQSLKEMDDASWQSFDSQVARRQGSMKYLLKVKDGWLNGIENFNVLFENVMRFSSFMTLMEKGGISETRAARISQDITTNFSRRGYKSQMLGTWWLFFNASVQGNYQVLRNLMSSRRVQAAAGGTIIAALVLDLLGRALADDWDEIPEWDKERFIILPIKIAGDFVKIPAPWVYNIVWRMGGMLGEVLAGVRKPQDMTLDIIAMTMTSLNPLGRPGSIAQAIAPTAIDPFVQILENKDFSGNPIGPEGYPGASKKANSELLWDTTPKGYQDIARFINEVTGGNAVESGKIDLHPGDYQLLTQFLTGSLGKFLANSTYGLKENFEKGIEGPKDIPIIREFFSEPTDSMLVQKYHTNVASIYGAHKLEQMYLKGADRDLIKLHEVRKEKGEELRMYSQVQDVERQLKSLRVRLKAAQLREDTTRENEIRSKMTKIQEQFNLRYKQRVR